MRGMNDQELQDVLNKWKTPETPSALKANVLDQYRKRQKWNWRRFFAGSLRVPVPVASLAVLIIAGLGITVFLLNSRSPQITPPPPQIVTRYVEVPVIKDRVVTRTVYRDRATRHEQTIPTSYQGINLREFQPVASLVPQIIRRDPNVDQN
jgi:hypothetical protein